MLQSERDYVVRMIRYFEGCISSYDLLLARTSDEAFDAELREAAQRCRDDCERWRVAFEQRYAERHQD